MPFDCRLQICGDASARTSECARGVHICGSSAPDFPQIGCGTGLRRTRLREKFLGFGNGEFWLVPASIRLPLPTPGRVSRAPRYSLARITLCSLNSRISRASTRVVKARSVSILIRRSSLAISERRDSASRAATRVHLGRLLQFERWERAAVTSAPLNPQLPPFPAKFSTSSPRTGFGGRPACMISASSARSSARCDCRDGL